MLKPFFGSLALQSGALDTVYVHTDTPILFRVTVVICRPLLLVQSVRVCLGNSNCMKVNVFLHI